MKIKRKAGRCFMCAGHTTYKYNKIEDNDGKDEDLSTKIKCRGFHFICKRLKTEFFPSSWVKEQIFCSTCTKILTDIHELLFNIEIVNMKLEEKVLDIKERVLQIEKQNQSQISLSNKKRRKDLSKPNASSFCSQIAGFAKRLTPTVNLTKLESSPLIVQPQNLLSNTEIRVSKSAVIPPISNPESQFVEENDSTSLPPDSPLENKTEDYNIDYLDIKNEGEDWFDSQVDVELESASLNIEDVDNSHQRFSSPKKTGNADLGLNPFIKLTRINSAIINDELPSPSMDGDESLSQDEYKSKHVTESPYTEFDIQKSTLDSDEDDAMSTSDPLYIPDNVDEEGSSGTEEDRNSPISFQKKDRGIKPLKPLRAIRPKPFQISDKDSSVPNPQMTASCSFQPFNPSTTDPSSSNESNASTKPVTEPAPNIAIAPSSLTTPCIPTRLLININNEGRLAIPQNLYRCDYCEAIFIDKLLVVGHYEQFHADKPKFLCTKCERKFFLSSDLALHINRDHSSEGATSGVLGIIPIIPEIQSFNKTKTGRRGNALTAQTTLISQINLLNSIIQNTNALTNQNTNASTEEETNNSVSEQETDTLTEQDANKATNEDNTVTNKELKKMRKEKVVPTLDDDELMEKIQEDIHNKELTFKSKKRSCSLCPEILDSPFALKYHLLTVHETEDKPHKCEKCPEKFTQKINLDEHVKYKHRRFSCNFCTRKFIHEKSMFEHIALTHNDEEKQKALKQKLYPCKKCDKKFTKIANLKSHILRSHTENCCEFCGKKFMSLIKFQDHLVSFHSEAVGTGDSGEDTYKCTECGKGYMNESGLRSHIQIIHLKQNKDQPATKNWICEVCGRALATENLLKRHTKIHDESLRKPKIQCPQCSRMVPKISYKNHLMHHVKSNRREPCDICGTVLTIEALKQHKKKNVCYLRLKKSTFDLLPPPTTHPSPLSAGTSRNLEVIRDGEGSASGDTGDSNFSTSVDNMEQSTPIVKTPDHDNNMVTKKTSAAHAPVKEKANFEQVKNGSTSNYVQKPNAHLFSTIPLAEDGHKCRLCGYPYQSEYQAQDHFKKIHDGIRPFKCPHSPCKSSAWKKRDLRKHIYAIHMSEEEKKPFQTLACTFCEKRFPFFEASYLKCHMLAHTTNTKIRRSRKDRSNKKIQRPKEVYTKKYIKRPKKPTLFSNIRLVEDHENEYACRLCGHSYKLEREVQNHFKATHDGIRPFKCPHSPCESSAWNANDIRKHIYFIHMSEEEKKPFQTLACTFCEKRFAFFDKSSLKSHIMNHTNERPFPCPNCKFAFQTPTSLKKHIGTVHNKDKKEGDHKCHICEIRFFSKAFLKEHIIRQHTGEYKCHICTSRRGTKDEIEKHFKMHKHRFEWVEPNEVQVEQSQSNNLNEKNQSMDTS